MLPASEGAGEDSSMKRILFIEAFYAGSHRQLIDTMIQGLSLDQSQYQLVTMTGRKWQWRARTSALHLADAVPPGRYSLLFTSSVTPLAELCGLRPDLARLHKVLFFHENQLVYPVRKRADTDFQYGYNQITASVAADEVVFNSKYNMDSFLDNINHFMKTQPDYRPKGLVEKIRSKCRVLYFPLSPPPPETAADGPDAAAEVDRPLHILWPHRWEHDKNPELFFETLLELQEAGAPFVVSVLGERYSEAPEVFQAARARLQDRVVNWGYLPSRGDYWRVLRQADVVVSTANHEFFGVAVLEAVWCGCVPLCVDALVYPELFQQRHLFRTPAQLRRRLRDWCARPAAVRRQGADCSAAARRFAWPALESRYRQLLQLPASEDGDAGREKTGVMECVGDGEAGREEEVGVMECGGDGDAGREKAGVIVVWWGWKPHRRPW